MTILHICFYDYESTRSIMYKIFYVKLHITNINTYDFYYIDNNVIFKI